jgi:hypothetical protein
MANLRQLFEVKPIGKSRKLLVEISFTLPTNAQSNGSESVHYAYRILPNALESAPKCLSSIGCAVENSPHSPACVPPQELFRAIKRVFFLYGSGSRTDENGGTPR